MRRPLVRLLMAGVTIGLCASMAPASNAFSDCINRLKCVGMGLEGYREVFNELPDDIRDSTGKPILSWRVRLLPFVEEEATYKRVRLDEPWDSPHNRKLLDETPRAYRCHHWDQDPPGRTQFLAVLAGQPGATGIRKVPADGPPTIVMAEVDASRSVEWTRPADLRVDPTDPGAWLNRRYRASPFSRFGSLVLMRDGTVRVIPSGTNPDVLRTLLTPDPAGNARLLSHPWVEALAEPAVRGLLLPPLAFSLVAVGCGFAVAWRMRANRPVSPGEQLWVLLGAVAGVHLGGVFVVYRYEPLPAFRSDPAFALWFLPAVTAAGTTAVLAWVNRRRGPWGWVFGMAAAGLAFLALDAQAPHQHRRAEEAFVTAFGPAALAAVGWTVGMASLGADPSAAAGRRWKHWSGVLACFLPVVWFGYWLSTGLLNMRELFVRIRD